MHYQNTFHKKAPEISKETAGANIIFKD